MATQPRMLPEELVSNLALLHDVASAASSVPMRVVSSTRPSVRGVSPKLP
jgi:hypothetical protein